MTSGSLTDSLRETLSLFDGFGTPRTTTEVAESLGLGRRSTYDRLDRLVDRGRLETKKVGASARVWWRPPDAVDRDDDGADRTPPDGTTVDGKPDAGRRGRSSAGRQGGDVAGQSRHGERDLPARVLEATPTGGDARHLERQRDGSERELDRQREIERYERIVEAVDDGIYAVDDDARFVMVNGGFCELTGYDREELLGAHATTVYDEALTPRVQSLSASLLEGEQDVASVELDIRTAGGERVPCESRFALFPVEDGHGRCGVVRDVSERIERERTLRERIRQQETIAEVGRRALDEHDVDALLAEAIDLVTETLDGDYCGILELDADAGELRLREGVGWDDGLVGSATVPATGDGSQAAVALSAGEPVVVEDRSNRSRLDDTGLLADHDVRSGISVVVGPYDDPWGVLGVHDTVAAEVSERDLTFLQSVANVLASAIRRHQDEQALRRQRQRLEAVNSLNDVVHEITDAVIEESTREEIERVVCEHLAAAESYRFAWIGDVDLASRTVNLRTEAGVEGYLNGVTVSVDPDDETSEGPTGRAFRTGEVQTTRDVQTDSRHDPWRDHLEEYDFRSSAAIPIVHEGTVYGVLNVYAARPRAFEGEELTVIARLGEVVGHAIASAERKRALMSDELVELEFRVPGFVETVTDGAPSTGTIRIDRKVPVGADEFLVYGHATADAVDAVRALVDGLPHWSGVTFREGTGDRAFELRLSGPPTLTVLNSLGGSVEEAVIEDGDYRTTLTLPPGVDVRQVTDAFRESYPDAELLRRRRMVRRDGTEDRVRRVLERDLTERQRAALEAAYYAGYFEWPRETSGETLAGSMAVSAPTFHQHLRKAERKVFRSLFGAAGTE